MLNVAPLPSPCVLPRTPFPSVTRQGLCCQLPQLPSQSALPRSLECQGQQFLPDLPAPTSASLPLILHPAARGVVQSAQHPQLLCFAFRMKPGSLHSPHGARDLVPQPPLPVTPSISCFLHTDSVTIPQTLPCTLPSNTPLVHTLAPPPLASARQ